MTSARALALVVLLVACGRSDARPPATEVPIGVVASASAAATAPPPAGVPKLPSAEKKKRPLTRAECSELVSHIAGPHMQDHRPEMFQEIDEALQFCVRAILSETEIECLLHRVGRAEDIPRCRDAD